MSEWIEGNMEIGVSERDGPALLDEEAAELPLWRAKWSLEHNMWLWYNTEDPSETRWDEWLYVDREGDDNPQAAGGQRSFWWNSRTNVSSWFPPKDPTRRTRACCWQRFVARMSQACVRMSLFYIKELDKAGIERLKRFEDTRGVNLEEMD